RDAADRALVANIRRTEPARRKATEMRRPLGDDRCPAHAPRLQRRGHASRGAAEDHDIRFDDFSTADDGAEKQGGSKAGGAGEFHTAAIEGAGRSTRKQMMMRRNRSDRSHGTYRSAAILEIHPQAAADT